MILEYKTSGQILPEQRHQLLKQIQHVFAVTLLKLSYSVFLGASHQRYIVLDEAIQLFISVLLHDGILPQCLQLSGQQLLVDHGLTNLINPLSEICIQ